MYKYVALSLVLILFFITCGKLEPSLTPNEMNSLKLGIISIAINSFVFGALVSKQ